MRYFWVAYAIAWLAIGAWLGLNVIIGFRNAGRSVPWWEPMTWEVSSAMLVSALAMVVYRVEQRWPLSGAGWTRRLAVHAIAMPAFAAIHTVGMVYLRKLVYALNGTHYDFGDPGLGYVYEFQKDLITYAVIVVVSIALRLQRQRRDRERAVIELERDLSRARLAQLTAQIEPHFMFNTLNAISNRMHEDVEAADRMIAAFAELLRAALSESGDPFVSVADDAAWLERYFELMRERFRGKLEASVQVEPAALAARIPRLLLQPLAENAFKHGLKSGRGRVDAAIRVAGKRLICEVVDNGSGIASDAAEGLGLSNIRHRLVLLYPDQHRFTIEPRPEGGTCVTIELPLHIDD